MYLSGPVSFRPVSFSAFTIQKIIGDARTFGLVLIVDARHIENGCLFADDVFEQVEDAFADGNARLVVLIAAIHLLEYTSVIEVAYEQRDRTFAEAEDALDLRRAAVEHESIVAPDRRQCFRIKEGRDQAISPICSLYLF